MRKNLKLYMVCMICILFFTVSCTNRSPKQIEQITIWHYYTSSQAQAFTKKVEDFNSNEGKEKKIYVTEVSLGGVSELETALIASANQEIGSSGFPDLFMTYADTAYQMNELGKVIDLEEYLTEADLSRFNLDFLNEGRFNDGKLRILPLAKSTEALFINKTDFDLFMQQHQEVSLDDLKTLEGLIEVSEIYYNWCGKSFYGRDSLSNYFVVGSKQLGVDLFSYDENKKFTVNMDKDVFKKLFDCYYVPYVKGFFTASGKFRSSDLVSGKILCYTGSTSSSVFFPSKVIISDTEQKDIESYVLPAPMFKDAVCKAAVSQGAGVAISKSTDKKQKAAVEFVKWLTTDSVNLEFAVESGYMPVVKDSLSDEFLATTTEITNKTYTVCRDVLKDCQMYSNSVSEHSSGIRSILDSSLADLASNAMKSIESNVSMGMTLEQAQNICLSEEHFENWYSFLSQQIDGYLRG